MCQASNTVPLYIPGVILVTAAKSVAELGSVAPAGTRLLDFQFNDKKLEDLYTELKGEKDYPSDVVVNFFEVMAVIAAATDERDFYALKSLHFEKLEGKLGKEGKRSMRITKQWRLIVSLETEETQKIVVIWKLDKHTYR
jgi:proteic killer suppression protein